MPRLAEMQAAAFVDELEKIAAARFEKEIAKGTITRDDVVPGLATNTGATAPRTQTRSALAAPAPVAPDALKKRRELNWMTYEMQKMKPEIATGFKNVRTLAGSVEGVPGGAARPEGSGFLVAAPRHMGKNLRDTVDGMEGKLREPVDDTLNKAMLQHEFGEVSALRGGVLRPHSSHAGVEPVLREQLHLQGDPEAVNIMQRIREGHPDDRMLQKIIRQVGGTADAPLAVGGRQQRAVERVLDRNATKLTPGARLGALADRAVGYKVPYIPKGPLGAAGFSLQALKDLGSKYLRSRGRGV